MRVKHGAVAAVWLCALTGTLAVAAEPAGEARRFKSQMVQPGAAAVKADAPAGETIVQKKLTKAEARALLAKHLGKTFERSGDSVTLTQHAHGGESADLGAGFQHAQVMVRDADGSTRVVCVDSLDGAAAALGDERTPAAGEVE